MTQVTSGGRQVNDVSGQRRDTVWYEVSRRTLDVIGSLLLLAFTLPLLLLVAFLIKVDSPDQCSIDRAASDCMAGYLRC